MVSGLTDTYLCQIRSGTTVTSCRLTGNQRKTCPDILRGLRITSDPCYNGCRLIILYPRSLTQTAVRQGGSGSPDDKENFSMSVLLPPFGIVETGSIPAALILFCAASAFFFSFLFHKKDRPQADHRYAYVPCLVLLLLTAAFSPASAEDGSGSCGRRSCSASNRRSRHLSEQATACPACRTAGTRTCHLCALSPRGAHRAQEERTG